MLQYKCERTSFVNDVERHGSVSHFWSSGSISGVVLVVCKVPCYVFGSTGRSARAIRDGI